MIEYDRTKQDIKLEAQKILESSPLYINLYEPSENEGILYSILILLEKNKDIFPETYELYKKDIMKITKSNAEKDIFRRREQMEIAGKSGVQFLKSLTK